MPVCVAYNAGQIPVYYNHPNGSCWHQGEIVGFANYVNTPHTPRYYFGHGLSYTDFAYRDLLPGEKKTVELQFEPGILAFLDEDMRWKIEKGEIQVIIGASSEDIRCEILL